MQILCPSIMAGAHAGSTLSQHQRSSIRHVLQPAPCRRRSTALVVMAGRQMSSPRAARVKPERWEPDVILNDDIPADQVCGSVRLACTVCSHMPRTGTADQYGQGDDWDRVARRGAAFGGRAASRRHLHLPGRRPPGVPPARVQQIQIRAGKGIQGGKEKAKSRPVRWKEDF